MNKKLTHEIAYHILSNLLLSSSEKSNYKSLVSEDFLLSKKIVIEEDGTEYYNDVWACQSKTADNTIKMLVANCSSINSGEYCFIISSEKFPTYGVYLSNESAESNYSLISVSMDLGKSWLPCQTYLQATFLAAMEQLKDSFFTWSKCVDYNLEYDIIKSFINHREQAFEVL